MAMVNVVLGYVGLFSDMGLSTAFVQRQDVTHEERSSLYWTSVALGFGLMSLLALFSPLIAVFFKDPRLILLLALVGTNFLVVALGQQLRMDAEKSLNFRPVAIIEIVSVAIGFAVAVLIAWQGGGVYALVASSMTSTWLTMMLSWIMLSNGWRPAFRLRLEEVKWFVRFGGGMVVNNVINQFNATVDVLLGGRILGAASLGFYSVPRNLIMQVQSMVNPVFTRVGFPMIASIQHDKDRVRQIYLKTMNMTASVNAPIYVALGVFAPEIVMVLLGEKWYESIPLLRIFAVWGLFRSFANPVGSLLFGLGRVRLSAIWNAGLLFIWPPVIWFGSQYGLVGMSWSMAGLMIGLFIPVWAVLVRPTCEARLWEYAKQVLVPSVCAGAAGGSALLVVARLEASILKLVIGLPIGGVSYLLLSWFFNRNFIDALATAIGNDRLKATLSQNA